MNALIRAVNKNHLSKNDKRYLLSALAFLLGIVAFTLLRNSFSTQILKLGSSFHSFADELLPAGCIFLLSTLFFSGFSLFGAVFSAVLTFISGVYAAFVSLIYLNDITFIHKYVFFVLYLFLFIIAVVVISDRAIVFSSFEFMRIRTDKKLRFNLITGFVITMLACFAVIVGWLMLNGLIK